MHYTQKHCQAAYGSIFFVCPADALPLLHALMLLSALVARSFLRCYIPAYSCLLFALMPLCGLQCHTLTRCCVCLAVLLLHHVQGARFCHLFPLLLLMLSNLSDIPTMAASFSFVLLMRSQLLHALMPLSALVARFFLRCYILHMPAFRSL